MNALGKQPFADLSHGAVGRGERRPVQLRGYIVRENGENIDVTVLDLSYDGCGISCPSELFAGEALKLSVLRRGAICAHVRWYADGRAGIVFDPDPGETKAEWPRSSERIAVTAKLTLRRDGRTARSVAVLDASPDGCKVAYADKPSIDDRVWVRFDGLEALEALVVWADALSAGLRFMKPIHPAVFDLLVERLRQDAGTRSPFR